jgi:hypothetical protein
MLTKVPAFAAYSAEERKGGAGKAAKAKQAGPAKGGAAKADAAQPTVEEDADYVLL